VIKRAKSFLKNYVLQRKAYRFFIRDWEGLTDLQSAHDLLATMRFSQNLTPLQQNSVKAKRILVIAPHPDDETIGPGGTLLKALKNGAKIRTIYLSCGTPETSKKLQQEANDIASTYGYETIFLDYHSKNIPIDDAIISQLADHINQFAPDVVFLPFLLDDHDDHRRASHLLLLIQQQGLLKSSFEVWAYQVYSTLPPNVVIDITDVIQEKEKLINSWKTQNKTRNWAHFTLGLNAFNQRFLPNGPDPKYAESFFVLPLNEYTNYCRQYFKEPADCYYNRRYKNEIDPISK